MYIFLRNLLKQTEQKYGILLQQRQKRQNLLLISKKEDKKLDSHSPLQDLWQPSCFYKVAFIFIAKFYHLLTVKDTCQNGILCYIYSFIYFMYTVKFHEHIKYRSYPCNCSISIFCKNLKKYLYIVFSLCVIHLSSIRHIFHIYYIYYILYILYIIYIIFTRSSFELL